MAARPPTAISNLPVVKSQRRRSCAPTISRHSALLADLPAAMTAHVVYEAFDAKEPATTSLTVVQDVIRGEIGFGAC